MSDKKIQSALVSVYYKDGLAPIIQELHRQGVVLYSTGGTQAFIESLGIPVIPVETLTSYPSILDGRVKTLHPKVFGGILARREPDHLSQLEAYEIPELDLVIVDLYPFEETLATTTDEATIIEKIDIGGISLIRAAAKNFQDVAVVPSREDYAFFLRVLQENNGATTLAARQTLARRAFQVSSQYDNAIFTYFNHGHQETLRYGENPHQQAVFRGHLDDMFEKLAGKAISFNNLVDIDAAVGLMKEFLEDGPTFAILKHTNACGVATRSTVLEAWHAALAADNLSAFGGILISNHPLDLATAQAVDEIFYEVLIAPSFSPEAVELLSKKKNRILLRIKHFQYHERSFRSLLNGVIEQDTDLTIETPADFKVATKKAPTTAEISDMVFANKCVKHLKSNAIALARNNQLIGIGCGQTSRVDAMRHAIEKAKRFGFDPQGSVMASDAFFPFADSVELAHQAGISAVVQPGGSIRDQDSIDCCDANNMSMVITGVRHFKH
jgi:phosphoribosylaminoimidazolecarboxamide formyltransferase/IMP cyclohydrolase